MAQRNEIAAIYVAGVIQGVALVTFPAASAVFTSASDYGLSSTEYGGMFVPQAITAIGSSLLGARLDAPLGRQAHLSAGPRRQSAGDGAARPEPVCHAHAHAGLQHLAGGHGLHGHRLRAHRPGPEHLCRGLLPAEDGHGRAHAERHCLGWGRRWRRSLSLSSLVWASGGGCR